MITKPTFVFTHEHMKQLRAMHGQGHHLHNVAEHLGIDRNTLRKGIHASGYTETVKELYPRFGPRAKAQKTRVVDDEASLMLGEPQKIKPEQVRLSVDMTLLHVRAAIMPWRKAA